jgi:hydrogenase expression/formation protein HypC
MCLGIPGRVDQWIDRDPLLASARIDFDGVFKICHMACVLEAREGDYVLVHAGIGLAVLDEEEAARLIASLTALEETGGSESSST